MTELDKLYEEIEKLLERKPTQAGNTVEITPENEAKMAELAQNTNNSKKTTWQYRGIGEDKSGQKYLFSKTAPNKQNPKLKNESWGYYNIDKNGNPYIADYPPNQKPIVRQPYVPQETQVQQEQPVAQQAVQPVAQPTVKQPAAQTVAPNEVHPTSEVASPVEEPVEPVEEPVAEEPSEVLKGKPIENDAPEAEDVEEEAPPQDNQAKQPEMGSGNTELNNNNRFKDVIDNPAIAKAIDAAQKPIQSIDFVTSQNGNQVVLMGESLESPIEVPYFISRFIESEAIGAPLGAGKATSLNAFMTADVRAQLEKAGKSITKIFLDSDGKAWFLDDKGSPVMLDKPEDHAAEKEKQDSTSNSQISNAITRDELVQVSEKIKGNFDKIKEGFFSAVGNNIYTISEIELGEVLNAEALKESVLKEADSQDAAKTDAKSPEKKTPSKGSSEGVEFQVKLKIECNKIEEQKIPENKYSDYLNKTAEYMAKSFTELKISTKKKSKDESGLSLTGNMATINGYTFKAGNPSNFKMKQAEDKKTSYIMNVTVICLKGSNNSSTFGNIMNKIGGVMASGSKAINKSNYVSV